MFKLRRLFCSLAICSVTCGPAMLPAQQQAVVVQGAVSSGRGERVSGVEVKVTPLPSKNSRSAVTDSAGRYSISFPEPADRYLVEVSASGWRPFRTTIRPSPAQRTLTADITLVPAAPVVLEGLTVQGRREKPVRGPDFGVETGGGETFAEGVVGALGPDQEGDLSAIAATTPGVLATPGGLSVLGVGGDQIGRTLNGMAFSGADLPRDAKTRTRVSTSAYDPARGGFSGAQIAVELTPGGMYTFRRARATLDAPPLQFTDRTSEQLSGRLTSFQVSAGGDGELIPSRYYYNAAVQASRRQADAASLTDADPAVLRLAGVDADSARRVLDLVGGYGVPVTAGGSGSRVTESFSYIGRLDRTPRADRTWSITSFGKLTRADALSLSPVRTSASAGRSSSANVGVQGAYSFYFGNNYLNETKSAFSYTRDAVDPYLQIPGGVVQVGAQFADDPDGRTALSFGGSSLGAERSGWTWETINETQWFNRSSRHKIKLYTQSRVDGYSQSNPSNRLGTFAYNSIADLAANRPSSYSRTHDTEPASGESWSGVLAVSDMWIRTPRFQLLYGVRAEANRFFSGPAFNPAIFEAFGARTDAVPNTVHLSPRLGFTWVYSKARQSPNTNSMSALGSRFEGPTGVLRGGVGEFRQFLRPSLLSDAIGATGLPGGAQRLLCLGSSVPTPDWPSFVDGSASAPEACETTDGTSVFADAAPGVRLFDDEYTAARSWRGNLSWNSRWRKLGFSVEGVYSLNLNQPGTVDLNFAGEPIFSLEDEGGRPVFAAPSSIVAGTGAIAPVDARISDAFGRVVSHRADLRSEGKQFTLRVSPNLPIRQYYLSLAYTLAHARSQARGFDGATFGSPTERDWAPSDFDARHQFLLQGGWGNRKLSVTMFGALTSGLPFTPLAGGDVNGDGLINDRAFVFDPATSDAEVAADMRALRSSAPGWARRCLESQSGRAAARNSCRGPWTQSLNARIELSSVLLRTRRMNAAITLVNPLGGIDQLLNGGQNLRGWGTAASPDPVLYEVRGFDAAARRFQYAVNPRFGETRPGRTTSRAPFRLTLDFNINLGPSFESQQLSRSLRARTSRAGTPDLRQVVDSIREFYSRSVPDVYDVILQESDSLLLTPEQTQALQTARVQYRRRVDAAWTGLAEYLARLPAQHNTAEAVRRQEEATDRAWEAARQEAATIKGILSPLQQQMLPGFIDMLLNSKEKIRIRTTIQ